MTNNILAMQVLMGEKLLEQAKKLITQPSMEEILEIAEDIEVISTLIRHKLIEELLAERLAETTE